MQLTLLFGEILTTLQALSSNNISRNLKHMTRKDNHYEWQIKQSRGDIITFILFQSHLIINKKNFCIVSDQELARLLP